MAIKFGFGKVKLVNEKVEETKPTEQHSVEFKKEVNPISLQVSIETKNKDNFEESKKSELKYIRTKRNSGIFAAIGATIFAIDGGMDAAKAIKEKDLARGIVSGITGFLAIGLGGAAGFILTDAYRDKEEFNQRYGK